MIFANVNICQIFKTDLIPRSMSFLPRQIPPIPEPTIITLKSSLCPILFHCKLTMYMTIYQVQTSLLVSSSDFYLDLLLNSQTQQRYQQIVDGNAMLATVLLLQYSDSNIFIPVARFTCIVVQRSQHFNAALTQS